MSDLSRENYERLGWADGRLGIAFDLLDEVLQDQNFEHESYALVKHLRDGCEDADVKIAAIKGGAA